MECYTPLHLAISSCNQSTISTDEFIISTLLNTGADPNAIVQGNTPIEFAARSGHVSIVAILLKHGSDPNLANEHTKMTSLHWACGGKGREDIVSILLENGAKPHSRAAYNGMTPLIVATSSNRLGAVQTLLKHRDVDIHCHDDQCNTAVLLARERENLPILRELMKARLQISPRPQMHGKLLLID
eukprot:CAMPEP_0194226180 /NCGR_PEP_ID=MMETSP0156-20130528/41336_1 /TAXON_ID=33649 /ORGANISM="Thalassionema nitzschioides, Strain L26-B" /LENGTH=185 /DNA_ID=CAMNT_0038958451 /DNA_START=70 /DNA_END=627 /DNA_ORIENTATION=-